MNQEIALRQVSELKKYSKEHRLAAQGWDKDWQSLIATILSARTRDETTIKICNILFKKYSSIEKLSKSSLENIQKIIRPVNFYRNKSKSVLNCAKFLKERYNKIPLDYRKLREIPGVGDKTANVFLAENNLAAIGVDTHLSYCSQKLKWTKNTNPVKIRKDLEKLFPRKYWKNVNPIVVRFGKTYTSRKQKDDLLKKISRIK